MFGSGNGKESTTKKGSAPATGTKSINSLVNGTFVEGNVSTESDFRIDGKLVGKLRCKGKVIIGPTGVIDGDIECQNALIEGRFTGNLVVHELLQVMEKATVEGEVQTGKLIVQSGSTFNVTCSMGGQNLKSRSQEMKGKDIETLSKVAQTA